MELACLALLGLLMGIFANVYGADYKSHKVFRLSPEKDDHLSWLTDQMADDANLQLDFWTEPRIVRRSVDVRVHPSRERLLREALRNLDLDYEIIIHDVQHLIDTQTHQSNIARAQHHTQEYLFNHYLRLDDMMSWLSDKAVDCGSRCSLITIGTSYQGRSLRVLKISTGPGKQGIWVDAGIHSREWVSHAVALYIIERFVDDYGRDLEVDTILSNYDVYIMPIINPDGYVYSHTTDRLWRKTMSQQGSCQGVDANRNFNFMWMSTGASNNPCSNLYAGPQPLSEPETQAVADFILARNGTWDVYLTLHSYSQLWMAPWGYTYDRPSDYDELVRVGRAAIDALRAVNGTQYFVGSASEILYRSSGTSRDWAKGVPAIPYVYTVELRDQGHYGFVLPPEYIRPSVEETWAGVKAMVAAILERH